MLYYSILCYFILNHIMFFSMLFSYVMLCYGMLCYSIVWNSILCICRHVPYLHHGLPNQPRLEPLEVHTTAASCGVGSRYQNDERPAFVQSEPFLWLGRTWRLPCSSVLVMTCFLIRAYIILPNRNHIGVSRQHPVLSQFVTWIPHVLVSPRLGGG